MFLSAHEIATCREHALNNLLGLSEACLTVGERLSELLLSNGREAILLSGKHGALLRQPAADTIPLLPATVWLDNAARASRLLDGTLEILGDTQKSMIRNAEAQIRTVDKIVIATLNRATRSSPWEVEIGLRAVKVALKNAETTLQGMSAAAIETVELAENDGRRLASTVAAAHVDAQS